MKTPRILLYDIENSALKIWAWQCYQTDAIKVIQPWHLLSFAWKWYGEGPAEVRCLRDYRGYWSNQQDDEQLTRELWRLMNGADVIVAHNGRKHDTPKATSRFAKYKLGVPAVAKQVDTYQILKAQMKIEKNSLDHAAQYFGVAGGKLPNTGFTLWERCTEGTKLFSKAQVNEAWDQMCEYNLHDVDPLLEGVFEAVRPYAKNFPNLSHYTGAGCPVCQSTDLEKSGWHYLNSGKKQRWRCMAESCGHRFVAGKVIKDAA